MGFWTRVRLPSGPYKNVLDKFSSMCYFRLEGCMNTAFVNNT